MEVALDGISLRLGMVPNVLASVCRAGRAMAREVLTMPRQIAGQSMTLFSLWEVAR